MIVNKGDKKIEKKNHELYEQAVRKERRRYWKRKEEGKLKLITDISERSARVEDAAGKKLLQDLGLN